MNASTPDAIYIGNMRTGSAFVRSYLSAHPHVHWTRRAWYFQLGASDEERRCVYRQFFTGVPEARCHVDMYESLFLGQFFPSPPARNYVTQEGPEWDPAWGASPDYRVAEGPMDIDPAEVARRVHDAAPNTRIMIVIREQVDWMRSMYRHYLSGLPRRRRGFEDFLTTLDGQAAWRVLRYDEAIEPYLTRFGADSVKVMQFERIRSEQDPAFAELCDFLGVDPMPFDADKEGWRNRGPSAKRARELRYGRLGNRLKGRTGGTSSTGGDDVLTTAEIERIRDRSRESNARLAQILGVDLGALGYAV